MIIIVICLYVLVSFESVYIGFCQGKASCKSPVNFKNKYSLNCSLIIKYYFNDDVKDSINENYFICIQGDSDKQKSCHCCYSFT